MRVKAPMDSKLIFLGVFLVVMVFLLWASGPGDTLDQHFYYTGAKAREIFDAMGPAGAAKYLRTEWLDLVFIATYSTALDRACGKLPGFRLHRGVAFLPGFFDILETMTIIAYISGAPVSGWFDYLGIITALKWTTGGIVMLFLALTFFRFRVKVDPAGT